MAGEMKNLFELNTGAKMPLIGLGTWQLQLGTDVGKAIDFAVRDVGYRHIDCAHVYDNEKEIGEALKKLFEEGVVKREELFITSKLWFVLVIFHFYCKMRMKFKLGYFKGQNYWYGDHAPEDASLAFEAIQTSLDNLQLDYLDLYLVHWPLHVKRGVPGEPVIIVPMDIPRTWRAMEAIYDSGKARAIGVSNFSTKKLGDVLEIARVPPAVIQVECHPSWQQPKLREFCKSKGVHLSAWSPLGNPGTFGGNLMAHPVVTSLAESLGRTPAQIVLRWGLQAGHGVLPKSTNEERIKENFDVFGWSIPDDLMAKFSEIKQERLVKAERYLRAAGPYKTLEELWDGEV